MERERKTSEKELKGNEREIDRGVKTIFIVCASLTSGYTYRATKRNLRLDAAKRKRREKETLPLLGLGLRTAGPDIPFKLWGKLKLGEPFKYHALRKNPFRIT